MYLSQPRCPWCNHTLFENDENGRLRVFSIDGFDSSECRKRYYISKGCQICHKEYQPCSQGWKIGNFGSYIDITLQCPDCILLLDQYQLYIKKIQDEISKCQDKISELYKQINIITDEGKFDIKNFPEVLIYIGDNDGYTSVYTIQEMTALINKAKSFTIEDFYSLQNIHKKLSLLHNEMPIKMTFAEWRSKYGG